MQHANYLIALPRLYIRLHRQVRATACYITESLICMLLINLFSKHVYRMFVKNRMLFPGKLIQKKIIILHIVIF